MFNNYQDLDNARKLSINRFKQNPNASISALFRKIRNNKKYSLIGDYPIIATILNARQELGLKNDKKKLLYATRQSEELKGKKKLLDGLITMQ